MFDDRFKNCNGENYDGFFSSSRPLFGCGSRNGVFPSARHRNRSSRCRVPMRPCSDSSRRRLEHSIAAVARSSRASLSSSETRDSSWSTAPCDFRAVSTSFLSYRHLDPLKSKNSSTYFLQRGGVRRYLRQRASKPRCSTRARSARRGSSLAAPAEGGLSSGGFSTSG